MKPAILLLVDDDVLVQELLNEELTAAGFQIVAAPDGTRAMAELDSDAQRFKAVITDIRLGAGPDGWEIGRRARELIHDMPIVYISGDSGHDWCSKGVPDSVMIAKPFVPAQIVTAVAILITNADTHRTG
jgi:DNA-binding response OmpR family regulator